MDSKFKQLSGIIVITLLLLELEFIAIGYYAYRKFTEVESYFSKVSSIQVKNELIQEEPEIHSVEELDVIIETQPCYHINTHTIILKDASCIEYGKTQIACKDCRNILKDEEVPKKEHEISQEERWVYTKFATISETGERYKQCYNCGELCFEEYTLPLLEGNSIYITGTNINNYLEIASFSQYSVDNYDIVYTEGSDIGSNNPFIIGHNYGSLGDLHQTEIGEHVYLYINGVLEIYEVFVSEYGLLISDETDIIGQTTGNRILSTYDYKTLHLYTCHGSNRNGRWMVLAKQIY